MRKCPHCAKEIDDNARFCEHCGADITNGSMTQSLKRSKEPKSGPVMVGTTLGNRFLVMDLIAKGGMGLVYKAKDVILDDVVALKVLKTDLAEDEEMQLRFKREIKVARRIKHPNVCSIYDFGNFDELFFISMEYLEGKDLSEHIKNNDLSSAQKLSIAESMLNALKAAHRLNIIHRDLKPSNIMITESLRPIIMDFGIARYVGNPDLTHHKEILGTPTYMAPEQFQGGEIDQRADLYAFGCILFEMYAGKPPFLADNALKIAMKHLQEPPPDITQLAGDIPQIAVSVINKCLIKDPKERYQSAAEVIADLAKPSPSEKKSPKIKEKPLVLVADDDDDIRQLLTLVLEKNDCSVVEARNGEEAVQVAITKKPQLICMDLMMPRMDGYQAAEFLRYNPDTKDIPIIMITCKDDSQYKAYGKSIGVADYITKPLNLESFISRISKYLS